jgi:hypothetical protein
VSSAPGDDDLRIARILAILDATEDESVDLLVEEEVDRFGSTNHD